MELKYNGSFDIATGRSRKETHWRNKEYQWSELLTRISVTHRTAEKYSEYMGAKKTRQDEIKDVGGYVGGYVNNGRRKAENIVHRQLLTLDIDFPTSDVWEDFKLLYGNAAAIYSTHKHHPESPRLRLILPLDRPVTTDEYTAIARRIAGDIDINAFDDTTYEPSRLMYWPSTAKDAEYVFQYQDGPWLSADAVLGTYKDWTNASEWPVSDRAGEVIHRDIKKQGDPQEKTGIVGTFCREYDIHEAIEAFLSDVYEPTDVNDRYTYIGGSTGAGLVVYDCKYAYSHHGTDPASGKLCNSFDLVRLHLYGLQDEDARPGTASNHLPSFNSMVDHASKDGRVRRRIGVERLETIKDEFTQHYEEGEEAEVNTDWLELLEADKKGNYKNTIDNVLVVLENDPALKGKLALNIFEHREISKGNLPWRKLTKDTRNLTDRDDAGLRHYLEKAYNLSGVQRVKDALDLSISKNAFHPVKDYLNSLVWDKTPRVETLFIDYLGAEDSAYTRAVTRKTLAAAVARIFNPGCKFDYVLTTVGKEGIGKSTIIKKLGREWFSESFTTVQGRESFEQLQGTWLMEMAELAGLKKAEVEQVKHFISKSEDRYRVAYGKRIDYYPRQCVFFGTTNDLDFLKGHTGNRRFWPVDTLQTVPVKDFDADFTEDEVNQVWAEAVQLYRSGEKLYLSKDLESQARDRQRQHSETDDRTGLVLKYLETLLPTDWAYMDIHQRRSYLTGDDELQAPGSVRRDRVSIAEIWVELFNKPIAEMSRYNTKDLHTIMKTIDGWEEDKSPVAVKGYGRQRVYRRVKNAVYNKVYKTGENGIQSIQDFTPENLTLSDGGIQSIQE